MYSGTHRLNIIIAGYIVGGPLGGLVWHHLQYVLGLHLLGYNVLFVEDSDDYPSCYNPQTQQLTTDATYGLQFIEQVFAKYGLKNKWAYYNYHTNSWQGNSVAQIKIFAEKAEVFINLSGVNPLREMFQKIPVRVFIDTDPAFTQIRHLTEEGAMNNAKKHNRFFSFGENFGKQNCTIPADGFDWLPTRQPVVMNVWNNDSNADVTAKWTTVMQWDSYKTRSYNGHDYGMKSLSFDAFASLPKLVTDKFELAIGSATAPREKLMHQGWLVADPVAITKTPETFQQYILASKGEWSIAKHGYLASNSGWFSERSCGYLASGRPVVVQDTGFSKLIETGNGLFAFTNMHEAIAAINAVNGNYPAHCTAAKNIAAEYFSADKVLASIMQRL